VNAPDLRSALMQHLWLLPYLLVYLFGLVLAIVNLSRCPGAAMLAMVAMVIALLNLVGGTALTYFVIEGGHGSGADLGTIVPVISVLRSLVGALATAMLMVSVFIGRSAPANAYGAMAGKPGNMQ
jgi:hypothetical protein